MKYPAILPARDELHADKCLSREEHRRWLSICEMCERLAAALHGMLKCRSEQKAEQALREIVACHDLQDGSVFCCGSCWRTAIEYQRTGRFTMPEKAPRNPELW